MFLVNWILRYITQKIFRENKWNKFGVEDPYYVEYETVAYSFFTGKQTVKKSKKPKPIPPGLSDHDTSVLRKVMRRAYHLEMLFNVFGYRIGWCGVIGIIPVVGDIVSVMLSLMLFKTARDIEGGMPSKLQLQFLWNIGFDFLIGLIPVVGTFVEVVYKANSRNALLLEKHLEEKGKLNVISMSKITQDTTRSSSDNTFSIDSRTISPNTKARPAKTTVSKHQETSKKHYVH